jgi:hypothetical protein
MIKGIKIFAERNVKAPTPNLPMAMLLKHKITNRDIPKAVHNMDELAIIDF